MTDTITLTRKEAQQVLDALCELEHDTFHPAKVFKHKPSINLLRARLAQPERTNQCGETCERAKLCATCARGIEQPEPEQTRSEKMREAGYTKRDTRLECDECGKKFTRQMLPVHDCQPEPVSVTDKLPKPEPVAWTVGGLITDFSRDFSAYKTKAYTRPLYTAPPQREWQGLTDAEVEEVECADVLSVRAIEQLLRSKNEQA